MYTDNDLKYIVENRFSIDYFISKFSGIHKDNWAVGEFTDEIGRKCARGHCIVDTGEDACLQYIIRSTIGGVITFINDGKDKRYQQSHAKNRVISALIDAKRIYEKDNYEKDNH